MRWDVELERERPTMPEAVIYGVDRSQRLVKSLLWATVLFVPVAMVGALAVIYAVGYSMASALK